MAIDKHSPFIEVPCKCPICNREAIHRYVKSKLYKTDEVEADQHVLSYKWESPRFEGIRPSYYHIWHCPVCQFADESQVFRGGDTSGGKLELIREKVLIAAKAPGSVLTRLGNTIDLAQEFIPLDAALGAHLLAVHIQEMLSPNMRQYGKLGRLYLRSAWLFREKIAWKVPESLRPSGFATFAAFLESLKDEWPEIPTSEEVALERAILYYQGELDRSRGVEDIRMEIQILLLMVEMNRRLGRRDDAVNLVRQIFQMATQKRQATRQALDAAVSRGRGTQQQIETLRSLGTWLNNAIDQATTLSDRFNNEIFQEEYPKAREVVLAMPGATLPAIVERLKEENLHEITMRRIVAMFNKKTLESRPTDPTAAPTPAPEVEQKTGFLKSFINKLGGS